MSAGEGMHWWAVVRPEEGHLEVFDPLGTSAVYLKRHFTNFSDTIDTIDFNEEGVQSRRSETCGGFCVYFLVQRYLNRDLSLQELLEEIFVENKIENERFVKKFIDG